VALLCIVLLALGLRLYRLDAQSLWNDEGTSVALAQRDLPTITRNAAGDIHPPLYYYLLHLWVGAFGQSEFAVRSLSALAGVALVLSTYSLGRRLGGPAVALLAALFSALSPFQVYYSQEARMYVFVSLFGLLSTLTLERLLASCSRPDPRRRSCCWAATYVVACVLTIYSQYFGLAVLLAQNIAFLAWLVWPGRPERRIVHATIRPILLWAGMQALILLCYAPWLWVARDSLRSWPAVAQPLSLPRLLLQVAQAFSLGVTVSESGKVQAAAIVLSLLVLPGILWPIVARRSGEGDGKGRASPSTMGWVVLLVALYLVVPIAMMYVLSLRRPLYKPKFLLVATPAYYLLQACGVVACASWAGRRSMSQVVRVILGLALSLGVCMASACSLSNLYGDPRYFRDDYRGIVTYINATMGPEDAILINAPSQIETVNYYYRAPLPEYPLPLERPIDTARTGAALQDIVGRHRRLYAILWAMDESDPGRYVETWLDQRCFKALDSWFGNVRLAVYAVPQSPAREIAQPLDCRLGESIRLRGYTLLTSEPRSGEILQLTLFWEALEPVKARYKVFTHVVDGRGNIVGQRDSEPGGGARLTIDWSPGEVITDNYGVLIPPGTPPGEHLLRIGMYGLEDGRRLPVSGASQSVGDALDLNRVTILPAQSPPPASALDMQRADNAHWGGLRLIGHSLARLGFEYQPELVLRPGDVARLVLFWRREGASPAQEGIIVTLTDGTGHPHLEQRLQIAGGAFPPDRWREGEVVRDIQQLPLPPALRPGTYRLTLRPDGWGTGGAYSLETVTVTR
jgi:4-amino-4-deoxy-L-arabinose transferase-like glycosyltransferase